MSQPAAKPVITDIFVEGARKGWSIATTSTLPNVVMAFIIIKALEITGALKGLGLLFAPLMSLFGLPGESAAVLIGGWMSMGGGIGVAVGLFDKGILTGEHLAIIAPAIYLMGSQVQYIGRILGVIGTRTARIPLMIGISVINAFLAMLLMRIII
ncbi:MULTISPECIES: YjiG family protein [Tenebrionibacter/Tenebrionicola group]|jgi:spore maturation protein SpmB|uniref:YjiG family protein n=2 Tax=Tenebrionibacter/Tenebrionicola group TaxID=2969848 RepID=A0A8K0XWV4_9ENTR|nr:MULTISPECIES: YjiG family protein [Tenebrionibacter/Tenebrionicola group]MBK4715875.1 YjiG family protein [Tenebrionibacter intestinalis]MBV4411893.1 YjiG family protein [Tenebrionicola larvae]MBV5096634.1 YjiG family protein [Tenebrionicola larvae]